MAFNSSLTEEGERTFAEAVVLLLNEDWPLWRQVVLFDRYFRWKIALNKVIEVMMLHAGTYDLHLAAWIRLMPWDVLKIEAALRRRSHRAILEYRAAAGLRGGN